MGIGGSDTPPSTASRWNNGACDVMAAALHRLYHLPLVAEFEVGVDVDTGAECLGYLAHAWVVLPDGRALDAAGIYPPGQPPASCTDPDDPWVTGFRVCHIAIDDPHFLDVRETSPEDLEDDIRRMRAVEFIDTHLASHLLDLGLHQDASARERLMVWEPGPQVCGHEI